jgi:hypothetical protein
MVASIGEELIEKDVELSGCGLISGTIPVYALCDTKSMKTLISLQDLLNTKQEYFPFNYNVWLCY